jgi:hypothetical protein
VLTPHRVRQGCIAQRAAIINQMRALVEEFGIVVAQGSRRFGKDAVEHLDKFPVVVAKAAAVDTKECRTAVALAAK